MHFLSKITVKNRWLWLMAAVIFLLPLLSHAQASLDIPTSFGNLGSQDLKVTIGNVVQIVIGFLGILVILYMLYGGFLWMTSGGDEDKIDQAKKMIGAAVVGLLIVLAAFSITTFIVNSLTKGTSVGGGPGSGGDVGDGGCPGCIAIGGGVIESHWPAPDARNVPRNTHIIITFKEPMDPDTVDPSTVLIKNMSLPGSVALTEEQVAWSHTSDNLTFTFVPDDLLGSPSAEQQYQVSLQNIKKFGGTTDALPLGYRWHFMVSTAVDATPPTVVSVIPIGPDPVSRNTIVQVNFSEGIDPNSVIGSPPALTVTKVGGSVVLGIYSISNAYKTAEFRTDVECGENSCGGKVYCFDGSSDFKGLVKGGSGKVMDMAGNYLAEDYNWDFKTNDVLDLIPPVISSQSPHQGDAGVGPSAAYSVTFSKPMSLGTINSNNIKLNGAGYWLDSVVASGKTQVSIQHYSLDALQQYSLVVTSGVKDISQNCYSPCSCSSTDGSCGCRDPKAGCTVANCTSNE
ncbi:MAG: Ig-like domain-containing protein [Candidatus Komeilibacteria bacterium]